MVNKVWYLDANRTVVDVYNVGWKTYLQQRETDERRRHRERANAERKIDQLRGQADKMRAKATKARAAQQMLRRADALAGGLEAVRVERQGRAAALPGAGRVRTHPAHGRRAVQVLRLARGVHRRRPRRRPRRAGGRPRPQRRGQDDACCACSAGIEQPDTGDVRPGHGLRLGYYAQEHETLDHDRTILENMRTSAFAVGRADLSDTDLRKILGAFLFTGDDVDKPAGVLSGGEKTRLALAMLVTSAANVLLLDEPTNNLDPVSREQVLDALRTYAGAIVLVTHDEGAVEALSPEKVILLPDGVEDSWSPELADLIALA